MASQRWTLNKVVITFLCLPLWSGICFAASFTVELGAFKTMSAVTETYNKIPLNLRPQTIICHNDNGYHMRSGQSEDPGQMEKILNQLQGTGLNPTVVETELSGCVPAAQFVETFSETAAPGRPAVSPPVPVPAPAPASALGSTQTVTSYDSLPVNAQNGAFKMTAPATIPVPEPPYADMNDPSVKHYLNGTAMMVRPETATKVMMSNRDINRIVCQNGPVKDITFSREKGIDVKVDGDNAFVKFLINGQSVNLMSYATVSSEFYVVCGEKDVYTLIATPKDIPAQTISLISPQKKLEKNLSIFKGMPLEAIVVKLVKDTWRDKIADSFTVKPVNRSLNIFRDIGVTWKREVIVDGEGIELKEYILTIKPDASVDEMPVTEKNFLVPELAENPVGISLEQLTLKKSQPVRLFIVEKRQENN